jgi:lysophospholipase L1-like esterase
MRSASFRPNDSLSIAPPRRRRFVARLFLCAALLASAALVASWYVPAGRTIGLRTALWLEARLRPHQLLELQRDVAPLLPARAVILAGDSLIGMMPDRWIDPRAVNFALGGATVEHIRAQLRSLRLPDDVRALVLLVGSNDIVHRPLSAAERDLRALLAELPANLPVILCTVPPVDPSIQRERPTEAIQSLNARWAVCAAARPNTRLVRVESFLADATGHLPPSWHQGDGLHLNSEGNRRFAAQLRATLAEFVP